MLRGLDQRRKNPAKKRDEKAWNRHDLYVLRHFGHLGAAALAVKLGRTEAAIRSAANRYRASLRRRGETRGRLFGIPAGADSPLIRRIRADVLAGLADMTVIERRVVLSASGAPLCPSCAMRHVEVERSGLCEDCHMTGLALGHALEAPRYDGLWSGASEALDAPRTPTHRM
jgi:hypothetical protein